MTSLKPEDIFSSLVVPEVSAIEKPKASAPQSPLDSLEEWLKENLPAPFKPSRRTVPNVALMIVHGTAADVVIPESPVPLQASFYAFVASDTLKTLSDVLKKAPVPLAIKGTFMRANGR